MILEYDDIGKAILVKEALKVNGIRVKFAPNQLADASKMMNSGKTIVHRVEFDDQDAERAKEILAKRFLI